MKEFAGYKLQSIRLKKGYSLEMLTRLMAMQTKRKLSRSAVSHWEMGRARPKLESVFALAEVFDVAPEYFFIERPNSLFDYRWLDQNLLMPDEGMEKESETPAGAGAEGRGGTR